MSRKKTVVLTNNVFSREVNVFDKLESLEDRLEELGMSWIYYNPINKDIIIKEIRERHEKLLLKGYRDFYSAPPRKINFRELAVVEVDKSFKMSDEFIEGCKRTGLVPYRRREDIYEEK